MSEYVRCVGCGEIVEATEPCSCLFNVVGALDAQGVLHTAERVPVEWTEEALAAAVAYMDEVEERAWLETERAAEWAMQQFVSQYGKDWLDEGDRGEMAYRRINAREKAEFPCGDPDDYEVAEVIEFEIVENDLADVGLGDEIDKDYVESYRHASQNLDWRTW